MDGIVAQRYAFSFYEVGLETDELDAMFEEVKALADIFAENTDFFKLLTIPSVAKNEKDALIAEVFEGKLSVHTLNFIRLLTEKGRMNNFPLIKEEFKKLYYQKKNIKEVEAVTAIPLKDELFQKLKAKLEQITGKDVLLTNRVDPSVLGGVLLKMDDDQTDGSVIARLNSLKAQLATTKA